MENSKLAIAILGGDKPKDEGVDINKEAMLECANGIMKAVNTGDVLALKEHLYTFLELWTDHEESESTEHEVLEHAGEQYDKNIKQSQDAWRFTGEK